MTRVFFFHGVQDKLVQLSALVHEAWRARCPLSLFVPDVSAANTIDRQLWTRPNISFVPHCLAQSPLAEKTPILIYEHLDDAPHSTRLINWSTSLPPDYQRFDTILEVVSLTNEDRQESRARARHYKEADCSIHYVDTQQAATAEEQPEGYRTWLSP